MQVRPANIEDVSAVAEISVRSWRKGYAGQVAQSYLDGLTVERRAQSVARMLQRSRWPERAFLVAEVTAGPVVGFANVRPNEDDDVRGLGEVQALYVDPAWWRQGVGRALLQASLGLLRTAGHTEAVLWVLVSNEGARRFYSVQGWATDGAHRPIVIADEELTEVRYRKILDRGRQ